MAGIQSNLQQLEKGKSQNEYKITIKSHMVYLSLLTSHETWLKETLLELDAKETCTPPLASHPLSLQSTQLLSVI